MIKPHKYLDIDSSVIRVGGLILKELINNRIISYSELYNKIYNKVGKNVEYTFLSALSFIYLFGKIKYYKESDTLELIL